MYPVVNLNPSLGQAEPAHYSPDGSSDCSYYQSLMDQAASSIALAQMEVQRAVQSNNRADIDSWNADAARANRNWEVAKDALAKCQAQQNPRPSSPLLMVGALGALIVAVAITGSIFGFSKLK